MQLALPEIRRLNPLLGRETQDALDLRTDVLRPVRWVGFDDVRDSRDALHQQPVARLCLLQLLLFPTAFGDVQVKTQEPADRSAGVAQRGGEDTDLDR